MSKKTEQKRLSLSDFFYADMNEAGTTMPILLPSGKESGEWLQVRGPDCDESIRAGRAYAAAYRAIQDDLLPLDEKCKAKNDWSEYNEAINHRMEPLNKDFAIEVVTGWSFDEEEFSTEAFRNLLNQYRGLAEMVSKHHTKSRDKLYAK